MAPEPLPRCEQKLSPAEREELVALLQRVGEASVGGDEEAARAAEHSCLMCLHGRTSSLSNTLFVFLDVAARTRCPNKRQHVASVFSQFVYDLQCRWPELPRQAIERHIPSLWLNLVRAMPVENLRYMRKLVATWQQNATFDEETLRCLVEYTAEQCAEGVTLSDSEDDSSESATVENGPTSQPRGGGGVPAAKRSCANGNDGEASSQLEDSSRSPWLPPDRSTYPVYPGSFLDALLRA
eukprot:Rhum_TRINITY_DN16551_c0_g1::Rhum_TRINITY_DN16551_c0_g1_i1::g.163616::m.163616